MPSVIAQAAEKIQQSLGDFPAADAVEENVREVFADLPEFFFGLWTSVCDLADYLECEGLPTQPEVAEGVRSLAGAFLQLGLDSRRGYELLAAA